MLLDGYILGVIGPVTASMKADMGMSTADMGLIASAALFGILIGSPLGGWASDKYGRKPLFMIDMALFLIASAAQFFSNSVEMLFIVRLLMGVAIGAEYSVGWPLMSEFAPARLRGRLMGVTNVAWYFGFMVGYTAGYILNLPAPLPWRFIIGTSTFIAAVLFVARLGLPESPRWLWSKGRKDEARAIAHKYLESAEDMADMEKEHVRQGRFMHLFSTKYWRMTVFVSWFWFCVVMPYFAIATFADNVLEKYGLNGGLAGGVGLSMVAVVGCAVTVAMIDKAGRRLFTVPPQWITMVVFLIIGLWSGAPSALVLGLFLVFSFLNAMNGVLTSIYPGEVFPTEIRGVGTGFAAAVSRIGAGMGTFLLPLGVEQFGVSTVMLIAAAVVFSGAWVSQLWAPETKGKSLSEIAATFSH
ncbi:MULTISPECIES: MFS transporter [unclassified Mesorhizobium]|uniref:MFS transporter n=1 Tax=unclassified Mesorhizobium TaxID=325217 RepID=UPI000BB097D7|nr:MULTISPECIES: MFS transporter [unclassified Mesorhizobium]PBB87444.1 MFS transporter [Mesorhizobium sp. WSM3876]RWB74265.1 MAG: MFS transporter [Mesorhizobium sp.]RWB88394.1 MAG: MFS transporter [Mesorhizobium sp.]RWE24552.1 MAG: MFS transporter [Mesorhizobium sp.]